MIFAAIGSINGNDRALEAALDAIVDTGIHTIVHTGNAVAGDGDPNRVMALLQEFNVVCVPGNIDRLVVRFSRKQQTMEKKIGEDLLPAVRDAHERLTSENLERLRDWRKSKVIALEEHAGFVCHGSPGNPREILTRDTPLDKLKRQREAARADIILCGGADDPFSRLVDDTLFVSPGRLMAGDNTAQYTLISTEERPWTAAVESVAL